MITDQIGLYLVLLPLPIRMVRKFRVAQLPIFQFCRPRSQEHGYSCLPLNTSVLKLETNIINADLLKICEVTEPSSKKFTTEENSFQGLVLNLKYVIFAVSHHPLCSNAVSYFSKFCY